MSKELKYLIRKFNIREDGESLEGQILKFIVQTEKIKIKFQEGSGGKDAKDLIPKFIKKYKKQIPCKSISDQEIEVDRKTFFSCVIPTLGIHKVIRFSPFNDRRHTSYLGVSVSYDFNSLISKIDGTFASEDFTTYTFKASTKGGQKANTTASNVRLVHKFFELSQNVKGRYLNNNIKEARNILIHSIKKRIVTRLNRIINIERSSIGPDSEIVEIHYL